eukprot:2353493-Amphidinium_carterae.1
MYLPLCRGYDRALHGEMPMDQKAKKTHRETQPRIRFKGATLATDRVQNTQRYYYSLVMASAQCASLQLGRC